MAVQSIGQAKGFPAVASALAAFGANPHIFNTFDGSNKDGSHERPYAFIGGKQLEKSEVADSSSSVLIDPTTGEHESGTRSGRMSMRADGYWMPTLADPVGSFNSSLYDIAFGSPKPWPYTAGGDFPQEENCPEPGTNTAAYAAALSYIAQGIHLPADASDVRAAYITRDQYTWSDQKIDLEGLQFESGHNFGEAEFCNLKAELQREFSWLNRTKEVFDSYDKALSSSGNLEQADLQKIGETIRTAVTSDNTNGEVAWSLGGFFGNMMSAAILAFFPEATPALAAWEAFVTVYELVRELVSDEGGAPVGEQVASKVGDLSQEVAERLFDTAGALVRLRDVIISDYGRLQKLGSLIEDGSLNIDSSTLTDNITTAARAFFSSELVPIPYGVYALFKDGHRPWNFGVGFCRDLRYGTTWKGTPASAQIRWMGDFSRDGESGTFPTLFVLGRHDLSITYYAYPPKELTDPMFAPPTKTVDDQKGYGMQLSRFVWEQYKKGFPPTDIGYCAPKPAAIVDGLA